MELSSKTESKESVDVNIENLQKLLNRIISTERLEDIFQAITEGVTVQDQSGALVYANLAAAQLLGYDSVADLLSASVSEIVRDIGMYHEDDRPFNLDELPGRIALRGEKISKVVVKWKNVKSGITRWSEVAASPVFDQNGKVIFAVNIIYDITRHKEFELALAQTNRRSRHILDSISDAFVLVDEEMNFIDVNRHAEEILGFNKQELLGQNVLEIFPFAKETEVIKKYQEVVATKKTLTFEEYFPQTDAWIEFSIYPIREGVAAYFRDITSRKKYETELLVSKKLSQNILDKISTRVPGIIAVYNIHSGQYVYANDALQKILGYEPEEFLQRGLAFASSLVHPEDAPKIAEQNMAALKIANDPSQATDFDEKIIHFEYRMLHKDGTYRWLHSYGGVFDRNEKGEVEHIMNVSVDITQSKESERNLLELRNKLEDQVKLRTIELEQDILERKRTEEALRESEEKYKLIVKGSNDGVWHFDVKTGIMFWNDRLYEMLGLSRSEYLPMLETAMLDFIHPDDFDFVRESLAKHLQDPENKFDLEFRLKNQNGGYLYVIARGEALRDLSGNAVKMAGVLTDITERREAEFTAYKLAAVVQSSQDAIISKTLDGIILSWNKGAERIYGFTAEEAVGKSISIILPPDRPDELSSILATIKRGEYIHNYETLRLDKSGRRIYVSLTVSPIKDSDGKVYAASAIGRDVTEKKRADKLLENLNDAIITTDNDFVITSWNKAAEEIYGWKETEVLGQKIADVIRPEYESNLFREMAINELQSQGQWKGDQRHLTKDGKAVYVSSSVSVIRDSYGSQIGAVAVNRDVTSRKLAEEALKLSERNLSDFFDNATVGMHWVNAEGLITRANKAELEMLGYDKGEYLGHNIREFHLDQDIFDDLQNQIMNNEEINNAEVRLRTKSGEVRYALISSSGFWENDKFIHTRTFTRDITARRLAERALTKSEKFYRSLIENSTDGVVLLDENANFKYISPAMKNMLGYEPQDLLGKNAFSLMHPEDQTRVMEVFGRLANNKPGLIESAEYRYLNIQGEYVWIEAYGNNLLTEEGVQSIVVNFRDLNERKIAQERLKVSERRFRTLIENSSDAITLSDAQGTILYISPTAKRILGYEPEEVVGLNGIFLVHPDDHDNLRNVLSNIVATPGEDQKIQIRLKRKNGSFFWAESTSANFLHDPELKAIVSNFRDISESKHYLDRQRFIFNASKTLSSSLDYKATLKAVAESAVPELADWCGVEMIENNERKQIAVAHKDPSKVDLVVEYQKKYPPKLEDGSAVAQVFATGKSLLIPVITKEMIDQAITSDDQREILKELDLNSFIIVPIVQRDKIFGVISMVYSQNKVYDKFDLEIAEELGRLAGKAVENALLYESARLEIDERKLMELAALRSERRYKSLIAATSSIVWNTNDIGEFVTPQQSWEDYTGQGWEAYRGKGWIQAIHPDDQKRFMSLWDSEMEDKIAIRSTGRIWNEHSQSYRYFEAKGIPIIESDGVVREWVGTITDVHDLALAEEQKRMAQDQMEYTYHHDILTDLPNRILFNEKLVAEVNKAVATEKILSVIIIDLDRFKMINESLGHAIGDRLLQEVALRLVNCLDERDVLARLGGDEFGILLSSIEREEEIASVCQRILDSLKHSFILDSHELYVTPSVGITIYPFDGKDASSLLKNADSALYRAKEQGRNNFQFYNPSMNATSFQQLTLENALRRALKHNEFVLYYQPQIDPQTGKIMELEALIRWRHPDLGLTFPDEFIKPAENTGLIESIGEWVLRTALRDMKEWHGMGFNNLEVAVNLSARQFRQRHLVRIIRKIIEESKFDARCLEFELTESVLLDSSPTVFNTLHELKKDGVKFSIDDFNTGYSSLNYIKRFPIDILKIDKSFVRGVPAKEKDAAIANSIINLAHSLGMKVVAEGVERQEQLDFLKDRGCDKIQGYLISPPVDASSITDLLMSNLNK